MVKKILSSVVREQTLDDEGLQKSFCEVEAIMNGRPITPVSSDPNDLEALTPKHLLQMKGKPLMPPVFFRRRIFIAKEDGNRCSTSRISSGKDGLDSICLSRRRGANATTRRETSQ